MAKKVYYFSMDEVSSTIVEKKPSGFWEFIKAVIISILIVVPVRAYVAQPFIVDGASMEPNFYGGNYLIIDELSYEFFREPARGEVVVFRAPPNPSQFYIKRIIGLPGESVEIRENKLYITTTSGNIFNLDELYVPKSFDTVPDMIKKLSEDEYFVLGDNRSHSSDSRFWGALPRKNITGRAFVRLWPIPEIGLISN